MPTRIVGTCCCGPPPFQLRGHIWVRIDTTWGIVNGSNEITGYELTYVPQVPARWKITTNGEETNSWNAYGSMDDATRTSFCGIGLLNPYLMGGSEAEDQLDSDNWAALITNISSIPMCFSNSASPVGCEDGEFSNKMLNITWSSDWSLPFTYDGVNYVVTFPENGTCSRDRFYVLSYTEFYSARPPYDHRQGQSWYARYSLDGISHTFSRAPAQNNGGSGE